MKPKQIEFTETRFEQVFHQDWRHCECEFPMLRKVWNEALGTFVAIRLCCMAKAVEDLTGIKLYEVYHFPPKWEWDCKAEIPHEDAEGNVEMIERGPPPPWLLKRLEAKGIKVRNLP